MKIVQCKWIEFANRDDATAIVVVVVFLCVPYLVLLGLPFPIYCWTNRNTEYKITITRTFAIFKPSSDAVHLSWLWLELDVECGLWIYFFIWYFLYGIFGCYFNVVIVRERNRENKRKKKWSSERHSCTSLPGQMLSIWNIKMSLKRTR